MKAQQASCETFLFCFSQLPDEDGRWGGWLEGQILKDKLDVGCFVKLSFLRRFVLSVDRPC